MFVVVFFFFKQKTAYEMRISDWSSDVCSSDLLCALLLIAGHETTANLMANGMHVLARDPGLFDRLKADPALLPAFVEELVRMRPPLQRLMRRVTRDVELGGERIPAGASAMLLPGSANRDSATWPDPIGRRSVTESVGRKG